MEGAAEVQTRGAVTIDTETHTHTRVAYAATQTVYVDEHGGQVLNERSLGICLDNDNKVEELQSYWDWPISVYKCTTVIHKNWSETEKLGVTWQSCYTLLNAVGDSLLS